MSAWQVCGRCGHMRYAHAGPCYATPEGPDGYDLDASGCEVGCEGFTDPQPRTPAERALDALDYQLANPVPIPRDLPCTHPATLTVTGRPGVRWCPTCGTTLLPDGTQEVDGR